MFTTRSWYFNEKALKEFTNKINKMLKTNLITEQDKVGLTALEKTFTKLELNFNQFENGTASRQETQPFIENNFQHWQSFSKEALLIVKDFFSAYYDSNAYTVLNKEIVIPPPFSTLDTDVYSLKTRLWKIFDFLYEYKKDEYEYSLRKADDNKQIIDPNQIVYLKKILEAWIILVKDGNDNKQGLLKIIKKSFTNPDGYMQLMYIQGGTNGNEILYHFIYDFCCSMENNLLPFSTESGKSFFQEILKPYLPDIRKVMNDSLQKLDKSHPEMHQSLISAHVFFSNAEKNASFLPDGTPFVNMVINPYITISQFKKEVEEKSGKLTWENLTLANPGFFPDFVSDALFIDKKHENMLMHNLLTNTSSPLRAETHHLKFEFMAKMPQLADSCPWHELSHSSQNYFRSIAVYFGLLNEHDSPEQAWIGLPTALRNVFTKKIREFQQLHGLYLKPLIEFGIQCHGEKELSKYHQECNKQFYDKYKNFNIVWSSLFIPSTNEITLYGIDSFGHYERLFNKDCTEHFFIVSIVDANDRFLQSEISRNNTSFFNTLVSKVCEKNSFPTWAKIILELAQLSSSYEVFILNQEKNLYPKEECAHFNLLNANIERKIGKLNKEELKELQIFLCSIETLSVPDSQLEAMLILKGLINRIDKLYMRLFLKDNEFYYSFSIIEKIKSCIREFLSMEEGFLDVQEDTYTATATTTITTTTTTTTTTTFSPPLNQNLSINDHVATVIDKLKEIGNEVPEKNLRNKDKALYSISNYFKQHSGLNGNLTVHDVQCIKNQFLQSCPENNTGDLSYICQCTDGKTYSHSKSTVFKSFINLFDFYIVLLTEKKVVEQKETKIKVASPKQGDGNDEFSGSAEKKSGIRLFEILLNPKDKTTEPPTTSNRLRNT